MRKWLQFYLDSLLNDIPHEMYVGLVLIYCIVGVFFIAWKGVKAWQCLVGLLLIEYITVILSITVIFRNTMNVVACNFDLFWTYDEILKGIRDNLFTQVIMNVVIFIPIGVMIGVVTQTWHLLRRWLLLLAIGLILSVSIEAMQFLYRKGFAELDDVMHNVFGCIIGFALYIGYERLKMFFDRDNVWFTKMKV